MREECNECQKLITNISDCPFTDRFYTSECKKVLGYWMGLLIHANIPPKFYHFNLSKIKAKSFPSGFQKLFLVDFKNAHHLLLTGKTVKDTRKFPIVLAQEFLHKGTCFFYRGDMFAEQFKKLFNFPLEMNTFVEKLQKTDLLIIDRIEDVGEWAMDKVRSILNYRFDNLKSTIITSKLDLPTFKRRFGFIYEEVRERGDVFEDGKII